MRHGWLLACHASEVAAEGDFVLLPFVRSGSRSGQVAVTRRGGSVVAFDNLCPHRGARIFKTLAGNAEPRCGYHGRTYAPSEWTRFAVWEQSSWVWVHPDPSLDGGRGWGWPTPHGLQEFPGGLFADRPGLRLEQRLRLPVACEWTVAVENALESEHVPYVHKDSFARLGLRTASTVVSSTGCSLEYFHGPAELRERQKSLGEAAWFHYAHAHLFPFVALSSTAGLTYSLQYYDPTAPGETLLFHRLYTAPCRSEPVRRALADATLRFNARVFSEDADACSDVEPDVGTADGPHDARVAHFRRHLRLAEGPAA